MQETEGVGHITLIEYVPTYQVMRVEFATDGALVVFFRVPAAVYSELKYLADSKQTSISTVDGTQRHTLGMKFWDIVRIRGQRQGGRYRYEYAIEGERTGSAFTREMEASRKSHEASKIIADSDERLYDGFARNMLSGERLTEYKKLQGVKPKEAYLRRVGII